MKEPVKAMPKWIDVNEKTKVFTVDPDVAYPAILKALGLAVVDQYAIEVAYQVAKMKVQDVAAQMGHDLTKSAIVIHIQPKSAADKAKWALTNYPKGRGIERATKGLEARSHYTRIRHLI